jgi:Transcriptional regulator containing PAS, AAA-type ATPase, and DNA-binding domains
VSPKQQEQLKFRGGNEMFEAISTDNRTQGNSSTEKRDSVPASIEIQLGVLKEVALGLLHQLEVLKGPANDQFSERRTLHDEVREFEIDLINTALAKTHGHQRKAARLLGLKVTTLNAKMKRYNIMSRFYMPIRESLGKH